MKRFQSQIEANDSTDSDLATKFIASHTFAIRVFYIHTSTWGKREREREEVVKVK